MPALVPTIVPVLMSWKMAPVLRTVWSLLLIVPELLIVVMAPPEFRIAEIVDDIVPVLVIVVMVPELLINSRPEKVPLLVMVVIVP